jgi:PAS domain S-box-containing protein
MRIEELEDSRRLELLINGVVNAIYTIDLEGNIVSWNSGAERLKGYTANETPTARSKTSRCEPIHHQHR